MKVQRRIHLTPAKRIRFLFSLIQPFEQPCDRNIQREQQEGAEQGKHHLGPEGGGGSKRREQAHSNLALLLVPEVEAGEPEGKLQAPVGDCRPGAAEAEAKQADGNVDEGRAIGKFTAEGAENGNNGARDVFSTSK